MATDYMFNALELSILRKLYLSKQSKLCSDANVNVGSWLRNEYGQSFSIETAYCLERLKPSDNSNRHGSAEISDPEHDAQKFALFNNDFLIAQCLRTGLFLPLMALNLWQVLSKLQQKTTVTQVGMHGAM